MYREGIALTRRRGLALPGNTTLAGPDAVAAEGFEGALGELTFENRGPRLPGVPARWDGAGEILLPSKA